MDEILAELADCRPGSTWSLRAASRCCWPNWFRSARLAGPGRHITIETAGTLYLPIDCDLMSISPKMSNSTPVAERGPALAGGTSGTGECGR